MMKAAPLLGLVLTLGGWILLVATGTNVLSGPFEGRTCQSDCVQTLFYAAVAVGFSGLIVAAIAALRKQTRGLIAYGALLLALALCAIFAALILIGNFGHLVH
jgi:hypothetical protein